MIQVLDKGHVELLAHMGDDLTVVNAARVSFSKESDWTSESNFCEFTNTHHSLLPSDVSLIRYLAKHGHWTPFGHCQICFRIKMPIFVARQLMRSNIGIVWNEVSRRYVDSEPEFYFPFPWRSRPEGGIKQGSSDLPADVRWQSQPGTGGLLTPPNVAEICNNLYRTLLNQDVAPEQARMVLPLSTYTEMWATMSLAACARVVKLRIDPHAQWEIQQYAKAISELVEPLFPVSWKALMETPVA